jgi:adenine-specific DNA-methyltransferase
LAKARVSTRRSGPLKSASEATAEAYRHPEATNVARPEAGQQARFRKRKPKVTYRYDPSLSPSMEWDEQTAAREHGDWLIACIADASKLATANPPFAFTEPRRFISSDGRIVAETRNLADAVDQLRRLSKPFLNWAGKAERLSFDVPTLPLFVHERLSTEAIIETLTTHRKDVAQASMFDLFGEIAT